MIRCPIWHMAGIQCARQQGHEGEHALKTWIGGSEKDPRCIHKWPPAGWPYGAGCSECAAKWFENQDEVFAFAHRMVDAEAWDAKELLYYFEKPWKWDVEHAAWVAGGRKP